jgi:hypothetical protein
MAYEIITRDGIKITGIPDDVPKDDQRLRDMVAQLRSAGQTSSEFGQHLRLSPEQQSALDPESVMAPGTALPPPVQAQAPQAQAPIASDRSTPGGASRTMLSNERERANPRAGIGALVDGGEPSSVLNMMGGVVRGAGPVATGALAGGAMGSVIPGVGTVAGAAAGAGAMGLAQLAGDPIVSGINKLFGTNYTLPTDAIEDLFTRIGVAQPKTEAEKLVQTVAAGAAGAGSTVALGQALQAGTGLTQGTRELVGQALASGPLQQVLGGAGSAAGSTLAEQAGAGPGGQLAAGVAGGLLGSAAGNALNLRPAGPSPMQGLVDDSARLQTQVMTSDVFPPKTFVGKSVQATGERIPIIGTGPVRAQQQANRVQDVRNLLRQFGADDAANASDDVMRDLINKRSANLTRWTGMQQDVLESVGKAKPGQTVPMTNTLDKIDDSINYLKSLKTASVQPAINTLDDWKNAVQNQSPENILTLRRQIGEVFAAPELTSVRSTMQKQLSSIYKSVNDDLTSFIGDAAGQQAKTKWAIANKELSKMMGELDLDILKSTLEKGVDRPEVVRNMLLNKDRSVIQALNRNLTADGRAAARTAIMQEVGKKVGDNASPEKFLTEMRKLRASGDPIGVFFGQDELKQIEGLTRVLNATSRASQAALFPATGVQAAIPSTAIAAGLGLEKIFGTGLLQTLGALAGVGVVGGGARLYESPAVRNILMKLPTVAANSVEEGALFKRLLETAQAYNARAAVNSEERRLEEQRANER